MWQKEEIEYLKNNFSYLSDVDLSKQLHKSPNAVRIKASRLNIKKYSSIYKSKLQLSEKEEQVIIGGLLGDLHCRISKTSKNPRLEGGHSLRQKEYLNYKVNLLKKLKWYIRQSENVKKSKYGAYYYQSKNYPCLNEYYGLFYSNNKKQINRSILDRIDKLGLLIWYLDDGCYKKRDKTSSLHTNNFSYDEQLIIKKWFEDKWDIFPTIHRNKGKGKYFGKIWYYLYFPVTETKKLHRLFHDFNIPKCMEYKLTQLDYTYQNPIPGAM